MVFIVGNVRVGHQEVNYFSFSWFLVATTWYDYVAKFQYDIYKKIIYN